MKKIDISDLFQSLENLGINREEIFIDQTLKIIQKDWINMVGELLADQSLAASIKNNKLTVICKHSLIAQELEFSKRQILRMILEKHLPVSVTKIHLKSGNIPHLKR